MFKDIIVREMGPSDRNDFIDMYNSFDKIMLLPKESVHKLEGILKIYDRYPTFGAYYENRLVGTLTARFIDKTNIWYGSNLFTRIRPFVKGLNLHFYSMIVSLEIFESLILLAESKNRFAFYTNKNLHHQLSIEKSMDRIKEMVNSNVVKKYRMLDYEVFYEYIYPIGYQGNEDTILQHKPFYGNSVKYNAETIVVFHTLNQKERKKILGLNYE